MANCKVFTVSGGAVDLNEPDPATIELIDIAHSLSMLPRFNGHTSEPYPVAAHSVHVSRLVPPKFAREGLFHDAAEAYIGDLIRPLRAALQSVELCELEECLEEAIAAKFGLDWSLEARQAVASADELALQIELQNLFPARSAILKTKVGSQRIESPHWRVPRSAGDARTEFLVRANLLLLRSTL